MPGKVGSPWDATDEGEGLGYRMSRCARVSVSAGFETDPEDEDLVGGIDDDDLDEDDLDLDDDDLDENDDEEELDDDLIDLDDEFDEPEEDARPQHPGKYEE